MLKQLKKIDWKARIHQKWFLTAIISGAIMILKSCGVIEVPEDWETRLDILLESLIAIGVVINPTTKGLAD